MNRAPLRAAPLLVLGLLAPVAILAACEKIAGIEDMPLYQAPVGPSVCTFGDEFNDENPIPRTGLRFGNLTPTAEAVDFCVKLSSAPSYGSAVLKGYGSACPGVSYGQVLIPLGFDPGKYDIKVVPAGAADCSAAGLSQITGVEVVDQRTTTVLRVGGVGGVDEKVVALPEVRFPKDRSTRFVNAIAAEEGIFFGIANADRLPSTMVSSFSEEVFMGAVPAPVETVAGLGPINEAGYLGSLDIDIRFGASRAGMQDAVLIATPSGALEFTIFAVGLPGSLEYPVRGLLCREEVYDGAGVDGVTAVHLTSCAFTNLKQITVDTINIGLYGNYAPFEADRHDPAIEALANLQSDVVCVQEITFEADRAQLAADAKTNFPYAYNPAFDLATPFNEPQDQNGAVPPAPGPRCGGASLPRMQDAIDCAMAKCAADPENPNSPLRDKNCSEQTPCGASCLSGPCLAQFAPMALIAEHQRCFGCLTTLLLAEQGIADTAQQCGTDANVQFAFGGASPEIMLSRFPLSETASYVLPSYAYRRAILGAKINIGSEESPELADVFCSQLSYPQASTFPYAGPYGIATTVEGIEKPLVGWESEQYLQAQRAIGWIQSRIDPARVAIIAGDFSSGDADSPDLVEFSPATVRLLRATFPEAVAPNWPPACTLCAYPENPYGGNAGAWVAHIFTAGREVGVASTSRILTEKSVTLFVQPLEGTVSDHFGLRSVIFVPTW